MKKFIILALLLGGCVTSRELKRQNETLTLDLASVMNDNVDLNKQIKQINSQLESYRRLLKIHKKGLRQAEKDAVGK